MIDKILIIGLELMTEYMNNNLLQENDYFYNYLMIFQMNIWILYFSYCYFNKYLNYKYILDQIYTNMYEHFLGNPNFRLSTIMLFLNTIKKVKPNSKVLDFGCGSGTYYSNQEVISEIKELNLKIKGIDIDPVYIEKCKNRIIKNNLEENINISLCDIFDYKIENEKDKFDYIIFSESAPLLSKELLVSITEYINYNLLSEDGKIIFINNLIENEDYMKKYKPLLKYFTMIEFGRVLKAQEFKDLSRRLDKNIQFNLVDKMSVKEILSFFKLNMLLILFKSIGVKNYNVEQYEIIIG